MNKNVFTVGDTVQVRGDRIGVIEALILDSKYNTILCRVRYTPKIVQNEYLADVQHYNKDYTILSYGNSESLDKYEIKSVRRNSDGEVFTIGDTVSTNNPSYKTIVISKFILITKENAGSSIVSSISNKINHISVVPSENSPYGVDILSKIKHVKQPLFTTEDGKEIFEGDDCYLLDSNWQYVLAKEWFKGQSPGRGLKAFSTKEAAEEYILINKPCLSINDIVGNWKLSHSRLQEHLKQLVKSKLEK